MQMKRGPATHGRVLGVQRRRDHAERRPFIKVERVRARGDVHPVGDREDRLETYTLLPYICMDAR
jgi:hypothetical protein